MQFCGGGIHFNNVASRRTCLFVCTVPHWFIFHRFDQYAPPQWIKVHIMHVLIYTRSSATAKSTARPSCLVSLLYDISRDKICWWLINHFYLSGHESYRIRRNIANYTAITPFKVIQAHRFWYQSKAHMRLVKYVKFSLATGGGYTLTLSLAVVSCEYRRKWYTCTTEN